jgi:hypothetical protein
VDDQPPAAKPVYEPILSPAQIEALADQIEDDTGCTVDRARLADDVNHMLGMYHSIKTSFKSVSSGSSVPEKRKALEKAHRACRQLQSSLQEMEAHSNVGPDVRTTLESVERLEKDLARWLVLYAPNRGRPADGWMFANLIYDLSVAYERATGRRAGTSTIRDQHGGERRGGPFVNFVEMVMEIAEPSGGRLALGTSVAAALRGRRAKELEPR